MSWINNSSHSPDHVFGPGMKDEGECTVPPSMYTNVAQTPDPAMSEYRVKDPATPGTGFDAWKAAQEQRIAEHNAEMDALLAKLRAENERLDREFDNAPAVVNLMFKR